MASAALLSCLGVCDWGPRHFFLRCGGEPEAVRALLRQAWELAERDRLEDARAPHLLAGLLRNQPHLIPLPVPQAPAPIPACRFRHRLVCRRDARRFHLRSWEAGPEGQRWVPCGPDQPLELPPPLRSL
ncbi:MAG: hypothetical protein ACKO0M_09625 [Cyanobium sp.]